MPYIAIHVFVSNNEKSIKLKIFDDKRQALKYACDLIYRILRDL